MARVLIADDHKIFRQGLISLLSSSSGLNIVAETGTGWEAWELIQREEPDIAVLDFRMPGLTGIEIAKKISEHKLMTRVILLTMHDDPSLIAEAKSVGISGYVLKDNAFENLVSAVVTVSNEQSFTTTEVEDQHQAYHLDGAKPGLSNRERLVLTAIAKGFTNKEIARSLEISPKTVDTYRGRIMDKLDLHSIAELTRHALRVGLVD